LPQVLSHQLNKNLHSPAHRLAQKFQNDHHFDRQNHQFFIRQLKGLPTTNGWNIIFPTEANTEKLLTR